MDLSRATLRLDRLRLLVDVGGVTHVVSVGAIEEPTSWPSVPWGGSGVSRWTEFVLRLSVDGRLWLERVDWEDIHQACCWAKDRRWFVSSDGAEWASAPAPDEPGRELARVET